MYLVHIMESRKGGAGMIFDNRFSLHKALILRPIRTQSRTQR